MYTHTYMCVYVYVYIPYLEYVCTYVHVYLVQKWRLTSCFGVDMAGVASSLDTVYIRIRVHTYTYAYTYPNLVVDTRIAIFSLFKIVVVLIPGTASRIGHVRHSRDKTPSLHFLLIATSKIHKATTNKNTTKQWWLVHYAFSTLMQRHFHNNANTYVRLQ